MMFSFRRNWPCVRQHDASDCAAAVVSTVLLTYKKETTLMKIRELIGTDAYGTSVKGIVDGLEKTGFNVKAVRTTSDEITRDLTFPAIAQVRTKEGLNHFIVIHKVTKSDQMIISDPAKGVSKYERGEFEQIFTGVILLMVPTSDFERTSLKDKGMLDLLSH